MAKETVKVSFPTMTILFLIFMTLKLTNVIAWSWWWVTAPLWMPLAIVLGVFVFLLIIAVIIQMFE